MLAGRDDFAVPYAAIFFLCADARAADALNAIGALFHNAAPADGDIRVVHRPEARSVVIGVLIEIEAPHFVRAVVRAEAGANAAIIDLKVEAFVVVHGGFDGTDEFTGSVLTMHARDGHMIEFGIVQ